MSVLFLTRRSAASDAVEKLLIQFREPLTVAMGPVTGADVRACGATIILSYNYPYLLPGSVFAGPPLGSVNAHIGYLPWNRGADPNFWSHAEDTPMGVTLHAIDAGIDTGPILAQRLLRREPTETLRESYDRLHREMLHLFAETWESIRAGDAPTTPQPQGGSVHLRRDLDPYRPWLNLKGWEWTTRDVRNLGLIHGSLPTGRHDHGRAG